MYTKTSFSFAQAGFQDTLLLDYLDQKPTLRPFVSVFSDEHSLDESIHSKQFSKIQRTTLVEALMQQYQNNQIDVPSHVTQLLDSNTYTITTGHQLCVFTGPLYLIYKICSTIKACQIAQKKHPTRLFIPVFWMASEDHDFEEIQSIQLFGKSFTWNSIQTGAVGQFKLEDFQPLLHKVNELLGQDASAHELISHFTKANQTSNTLAQATRILLSLLFKNTLLLIIDGDDALLKKQANALFLNDLSNQTSFKEVNKTIQELEKLGYKTQAKPREVNFFHISKGVRERIVYKDQKTFVFEQSGLSFTPEEIQTYFEHNPQSLSPNVITRPLYQEYCLPNIGVICGPAEMKYWLQLKGLFTAHSISYPMIIVRDSFMVLAKSDVDKFQKIGFQLSDVFESEQALIQMFLQKVRTDDLSQEKKSVDSILDDVQDKLTQVDASLTSFAQAQKKLIDQVFDSMEKKLSQTTRKKHEIQVEQIKKIKAKYFPDQNYQDRVENIIPFYLKTQGKFIDEIIENAQPFDGKFGVLVDA